MRSATLFSGIGAPECAASWLDWRWSAEIDPFAVAVHAARFPGVPNLGDVNRIDPDAIEPVDLVVFGSPCQSFSVAGKRLGLDDPRGNLALVALRLIGKLRPDWLVFENVPGLLSSDNGRDFGAFLGLLGECGYGFAYRILDAQFAGVPQRRRRVFVVGCLGDWRGPAAVLFEPESLRGDTAPRREAGQRIARPVASWLEGGSGYRNDADTADNLIGFHPTLRQPEFGNYEDCSPTLRHEASAIAFSAKDHGGDAGETAPTLRAGQHHKSHANAGVMPAVVTHSGEDGTGRGTPIIPVGRNGELAATLQGSVGGNGNAGNGSEAIVAVAAPLTLAIRGRGDSHDLEYRQDGTANAILTPNGGRAGIGVGAVAAFKWDMGAKAGGIGYAAEQMGTMHAKTGSHAVQAGMSVRRLTPRECERLQGFPDDFTAITYRGKPAADGPRYRALGNSMAVPVIGWVLGRIREVAA